MVWNINGSCIMVHHFVPLTFCSWSCPPNPHMMVWWLVRVYITHHLFLFSVSSPPPIHLPLWTIFIHFPLHHPCHGLSTGPGPPSFKWAHPFISTFVPLLSPSFFSHSPQCFVPFRIGQVSMSKPHLHATIVLLYFLICWNY